MMSSCLHQNKVAPLLCILLLATPMNAADESVGRPGFDAIADLSLEELMQVKVTSVSKRPERRGGAASAIYVLTGEDVENDGFRSIPDSLRYVPGMQVAQLNSHTWAISARGFNAEYATKLLVLVDGRSVYTPLNAGVYWDAVDVPEADLDRIEVIRGPGGTLWGANAVNGVVNIISKSARETQGTLVTGGGGSHERAFGTVRYGGQLGDETYYRVYGKYDLRDDLLALDDPDAADRWQMGRGGFRIDSGHEAADLLTVQGDVYVGEQNWSYAQPVSGVPANVPVSEALDLGGANLLARWQHAFADDSRLTWQNYVDFTERESNLPKETRWTFDTDLQYQSTPIVRNDVVVGVGYRVTGDEIENNFANAFIPDSRTLHLVSAFLHDRIALVENRLHLTLGSKVEHNDFTGFEYQPSGRLAWTPTDRQTLWASVSRAIRTPSRAEDDVLIHRIDESLGVPIPVSIHGDADGVSEETMAYEIGYRVIPSPNVSLDIAAFYNVYDRLRSLEPDLLTLTNLFVDNGLEGEAWGVEVAADWRMLDWWRWRGTYTHFSLNLWRTEGGLDVGTVGLLENTVPRHQFTLRSEIQLPRDIRVDVGIRYVDELANTGSMAPIPAYAELDLRVSWRPSPHLEFSISGLNLLDSAHPEFAPSQVVTAQREVRRSVYGQLTWRF